MASTRVRSRPRPVTKRSCFTPTRLRCTLDDLERRRDPRCPGLRRVRRPGHRVGAGVDLSGLRCASSPSDAGHAGRPLRRRLHRDPRTSTGSPASRRRGRCESSTRWTADPNGALRAERERERILRELGHDVVSGTGTSPTIRGCRARLQAPSPPPAPSSVAVAPAERPAPLSYAGRRSGTSGAPKTTPRRRDLAALMNER